MKSEIEHFDVKLVGVTRRNANGSNRQTLIRSCHPGEFLSLEPEPDNPADENAIRVCKREGDQIGYIPADTARIMQQRARARNTSIEDRYKAVVNNIHGGSGSKRSIGITVSVIAPNPHGNMKTITDEEARIYSASFLKLPTNGCLGVAIFITLVIAAFLIIGTAVWNLS